MLNFTCRDGVLFAKEAQNLFQHKLRKQKTFALLQSEEYLPRINIFFGEGFRGYLISGNFMEFCSLELLVLCFSTY